MKKYLLPEGGQFYKANLHCHTTLSDGKCTPEEIKEAYKAHGYSVVAFTDHDILVPHPELSDEDFIPLNGFEVEINKKCDRWPETKTCHICFIAKDPENFTQPCYNEAYLFGNAPSNKHLVKFDENEPPYKREYSPEGVSDIMKKCRDKGFFVTYNHPTWSLERYPDYIGYEGMHAMEIVNFGCVSTGFEEYNSRVYEDFLQTGKRIFATATDDNHNYAPFDSSYSDSFGGFTMIKAEKLDYKSITDALFAGNFYASMGPEIYELWYEDDCVHIICSDAVKIELNTCLRANRVYYNKNVGETVNEAIFKIDPKEIYFRITVYDKEGKRASTNAYFLDEILK